MAYDKDKYSKLRSLKVGHALALALANDESPVGGGGYELPPEAAFADFAIARGPDGSFQDLYDNVEDATGTGFCTLTENNTQFHLTRSGIYTFQSYEAIYYGTIVEGKRYWIQLNAYAPTGDGPYNYYNALCPVLSDPVTEEQATADTENSKGQINLPNWIVGRSETRYFKAGTRFEINHGEMETYAKVAGDNVQMFFKVYNLGFTD